MDDSKFEAPASAGEMSEQERDIAQWRVNVTAPGIWKIDEIFGEYWKDQSNKTHYGKVFKKAVESELLSNIAVHALNGREVLSSDRQLLYEILHTGSG